MLTRGAVPVDSSWLIDCVRRHLPDGVFPEPGRLREALAAYLADPRKPRGIRHALASMLSVLVAGVACGYSGPLAIAQAAAGWDQEVLAGHGCRRVPATGLLAAPSASTLYRLPAQLDADAFEAGLSACLAAAALDPQIPARAAARRAAEKDKKKGKPRRRKPPAAAELRQVRPATPSPSTARNARAPSPAGRPRCTC